MFVGTLSSCTCIVPPKTCIPDKLPPVPSTSQIGILPFSKLASPPIKATFSIYFNDLESKIAHILKNRFSIKNVAYPPNKRPFTYEEMNTPDFEIDPGEFTTAELILENISKTQRVERIIFGHLEESGDSLIIAAHLYSASDNAITLISEQKVGLKGLQATTIETAIKKLAIDIIKSKEMQSSTYQKTAPIREKIDEDSLYGLDKL